MLRSFREYHDNHRAIVAELIKKIILKKVCYLLIVKPLVYLTRIEKNKIMVFKAKMIKKVEIPNDNLFSVDENFISKSIGLGKSEYNNRDVKVHFSDNFIYIEYELRKSPVSNFGHKT